MLADGTVLCDAFGCVRSDTGVNINRILGVKSNTVDILIEFMPSDLTWHF